jgi:ribonuclease D
VPVKMHHKIVNRISKENIKTNRTHSVSAKHFAFATAPRAEEERAQQWNESEIKHQLNNGRRNF